MNAKTSKAKPKYHIPSELQGLQQTLPALLTDPELANLCRSSRATTRRIIESDPEAPIPVRFGANVRHIRDAWLEFLGKKRTREPIEARRTRGQHRDER